MMQRQTLACAGAGIAIGICGSLMLATAVRALLFQVSPRDPLVIVAAGLSLLTIAIVAAAKPSWKAAQIDPANALRVD